MATNTEVQELDSGGAGGWQGTLQGSNNNGPPPTPNHVKTYVFERTFKNCVKSDTMNDQTIAFKLPNDI